MANITMPFASFDGGLVTVRYVYNDANMNIGRVLVTNNSDYSVWVQASEPVVGTVEWTIAPHSDVWRVLGSYKLVLLPIGPDNPDGPLLTMGNLILRARYPA